MSRSTAYTPGALVGFKSRPWKHQRLLERIKAFTSLQQKREEGAQKSPMKLFHVMATFITRKPANGNFISNFVSRQLRSASNLRRNIREGLRIPEFLTF